MIEGRGRLKARNPSSVLVTIVPGEQIDGHGGERDGEVLDPAVTHEFRHASEDALGGARLPGERGVQLPQDGALRQAEHPFGV